MQFLNLMLYFGVVGSAKHHQIAELDIISSDAYSIIDQFFEQSSIEDKVHWKKFIKRKRSQLIRLLSRPDCYNETIFGSDFTLIQRPQCSGIEAVNHIDVTLQKWIRAWIRPDCRGDFADRLVARIMSFVSRLYYHVDLNTGCSPVIENPPHDTEIDQSCQNTTETNVSPMLVRSMLSSLKVSFKLISSVPCASFRRKGMARVAYDLCDCFSEIYCIIQFSRNWSKILCEFL